MYFGRGKNKVQNPITIVDIYKDYVKNIGGSEDLYYVDYNTFSNIWKEYISFIIEEVLFKGKKFKMPNNLGVLQIIKKKVSSSNILTMPIDWKTTLEVGKKVCFFNDHTGGFKYLFRWNKTNSTIKFKYYYAFSATRTLKRKLARLIIDNKVDFFEYQN